MTRELTESQLIDKCMQAFILILYTCIVWFIYQWILMIDNIYFKCFNHFCVCECNPLILCLEDKLPKFVSIYVPEKKYTCTTDQLYFRREIIIGNAPLWIFEILVQQFHFWVNKLTLEISINHNILKSTGHTFV